MDLYFLLMLSLVFILPLLFVFKQRRNDGRRKLPPGPFKLPIIGNQLISDLPHLSLQRLSKTHGPIMFLQSGSIPTLVISSADMAQQIFKSHDAIFSSRPALYAAKRLTYNCSDMAFSPYGEHWREVRKVAVLELFSVKKVQSFQAVREEEVAHMIASIGNSEGPIDLSETLLHLTNDVLCRVAFGRKYNRDIGFHALLLETEELFGGFVVGDFFPWLRWIHTIDGLDAKLQKIHRKLDEFCNQVIEEHLDPRRSNPEVEDLVDVILRVQKEDVLKIKLTSDTIKGIIMDMFLAGTGASAATLVWTMTALRGGSTWEQGGAVDPPGLKFY